MCRDVSALVESRAAVALKDAVVAAFCAFTTELEACAGPSSFIQPGQSEPRAPGEEQVRPPSNAERHLRYLKFWSSALLAYAAVLLVARLLWQFFQGQSMQADTSDEVAGTSETKRAAAAASGEAKDAAAAFRGHVSNDNALRFDSGVLESMWVAGSEQPLLKRGSRVLCFIALCGTLYYAAREWDTPKCVHSSMEPSIIKFLRLSQVTTSFAACAIAFVMACSDTICANMYRNVVLFFAMWLPAMHCPPFQFSSDRIQWACEAEIRSQSDAAVFNQLEYSDFSLLGMSSTMVQMTWLLVLPWVVPRYSMILVAFLWVLGVYLGWGILYSLVFPEPVLAKIVDLRRPFDILLRTLFLLAVWMVSAGKKWHLERSERNRFAHSLSEFHETKKLYTVLARMVPEYVIPPMLEGEVIAHFSPCVSILFSRIANFDKCVSSKTPKQLICFLNTIFDGFDVICADLRVTKIETWGHEYVACVGTDPEDDKLVRRKGHRVLLERLLRAGVTMMKLQETQGVEFHMGVHTGPILAGVIGCKVPRYRLFGDTISAAAQQMQTSIAGELQFGQETALELTCSSFGFSYRGSVSMKGKGLVPAYILDRAGLQGLLGFNVASSASGDLRQRLLTSLKVLDAPPQSSEMRADDSYLEGLEADAVLSHDEEDDELSKTLRGIIKSIMAKSGGEGRHFVLSERDGFTPEMEVLWREHYHRDFCSKLPRRMGRICLMLVFLSQAEFAYLRYVGQEWKAKLFQDHLPIYLMARGACIIVQLVWWYVAEARSEIIVYPFLSQASTLLATVVSAVLLGISYMALSDMHTLAGSLSVEAGRQLLVLIYVLLVHMILRSHEFLFSQSLLWPFVALAFMACEAHFKDHTLLPFRGKVMFVINAILNSMMCHESEQESRAYFKSNHAKSKTMERTQDILDTLMPPLVLGQIRKLQTTDLPSHCYRHATFVQLDLCGFTKLVGTMSPTKVVELVQDLFGRFDLASTKRGIYKVENVGDAYIAGTAEMPLTAENSPADVVMFGLDMVQETQAWSEGINANVQCTVGVHSGQCVGGFVGNDMQRYHIFGKMMKHLMILESCGIEGRVHISSACKAEVERQMEKGSHDLRTIRIDGFEERTDALQTSEGDEHSDTQVGGRTYLVRFYEAGWPAMPCSSDQVASPRRRWPDR